MPRAWHQLLHGYAGGHRLLAGSIELPLIADRVILELSDLPGAVPESRFNPYVSAYPVPGIDYYAVGMSWLATEQTRPGAVWTHTLLIPTDQLMHIEDFNPIMDMFRRPSTEPGLGRYRSPLEAPASRGLGAGHIPATLEHVASILRAIYVRPRQTGRVVADGSDEFLAAIMRVWRQQWPQLRLSFSFCTAAYAPRHVGDRPFALEIVPRNVNRFRGPTDVSEQGPPTGLFSPHWLEVAANDALEPLGPITKASADLSGGLKGDRALFEPFANLVIVGIADVPASTERALRLIGQFFPEATQISELKSQVVRSAIKDPEGARVVVSLVATEPNLAEALGPDVQLVAETLVQLPDHTAEQLLGSPSISNVFREATISVWAARLEARDVTRVLKLPAPIARRLLSGAPVMRSAEAWAQNREHIGEIVSTLGMALKRDRDLRLAFGQALVTESDLTPVLSASDDISPRDICEIIGDAVRRSEQPLHIASPSAQSLLLRHAALTFDVLTNRSPNWAALSELLAMVPVGTVALTDHLTGVRKSIAVLGRIPERDGLRIAAFLFATSLATSDVFGAEVAVGTFEALHTAGANDRIPTDTWSGLESFLPSLGWFNWDKCERLRRGLLNAFKEFDWPLTSLSSPGWRQSTRDAVGTTLSLKQFRGLQIRLSEHAASDA